MHPETVSERSRILRDLARAKRDRFHASLVGQTREAIVENPDSHDASLHLATTDNYAAVTVACDLPPGTLIQVRPNAWRDGRLHAHLEGVLRKVTS